MYVHKMVSSQDRKVEHTHHNWCNSVAHDAYQVICHRASLAFQVGSDPTQINLRGGEVQKRINKPPDGKRGVQKFRRHIETAQCWSSMNIVSC